MKPAAKKPTAKQPTHGGHKLRLPSKQKSTSRQKKQSTPKEAPQSVKQWVTPKQAANAIGKDDPWIHHWIERGVLMKVEGKVDLVQVRMLAEIQEGETRGGDRSLKAYGLDNELDVMTLKLENLRAKTKEAYFKALILELDYKTKESNLIPLEDIRDTIQAFGNSIREKVSALPYKFTPLIMSRFGVDRKKSKELQEFFENEFNQVLKEIHEQGQDIGEVKKGDIVSNG